MNTYIRFNEKVAEKMAQVLSSMEFFWFCVVIDAIELKPVIDAHSVIIWCGYVSQTVIQLIALPVLAHQQNQTHKNHKEMKEHHARLEKKIDRLLKKK